MQLRTTRGGGGRCSALRASPCPSLSSLPTVTAFQVGQASLPGRARIITMVNTHETVASTGLDNSHDGTPALLPCLVAENFREFQHPAAGIELENVSPESLLLALTTVTTKP